MERRRNNGLCAQRGKQPTVVGWGWGGSIQHSPCWGRGEGAFLGLCLPVRDLRDYQSIRAVLLSCFVLLNPQVPTGKPPVQVRRISVRSFLDLHKQSEFCSALQGAAGKFFLRAGTGLPGLCAESNTLLSCSAHAWGLCHVLQVCLVLHSMCQTCLPGPVCDQWLSPTLHTSQELREGHQGAAVAPRREWAPLL